MTRRKRVLFVAEAVSLAQVVRLRELASALDPARFEVSFASAAFDPLVFDATTFARHAISSVSPRSMHRRIALGLRLYDTRTLAGYVRDELALFERVEPDFVVSDLRLSLCVSAPLSGVRHAALINAYWNPPDGAGSFPVPEHPLVNLLGVARVAPHFRKGLSFALDHFAAPINTLRSRHGLSPLGNLLDVLTHGDHVLYPDVPELTPVAPQPPHHHFLGPVSWAPRLPLPAFWDGLDPAIPIVYVTLGSSGKLAAVRAVLEGLAPLPVQVLLATAGRFDPRRLADNVFAASYLPGDLAARRARLVICNGGSSTAYQALREGAPVLGLPFNLDQYLASAAIERAGAGRVLRSGTLTASAVREAVCAMLADAALAAAARRAGAALGRLDARERFCAFVDAATGTHSGAPRGAAELAVSPAHPEPGPVAAARASRTSSSSPA